MGEVSPPRNSGAAPAPPQQRAETNAEGRGGKQEKRKATEGEDRRCFGGEGRACVSTSACAEPHLPRQSRQGKEANGEDEAAGDPGGASSRKGSLSCRRPSLNAASYARTTSSGESRGADAQPAVCAGDLVAIEPLSQTRRLRKGTEVPLARTERGGLGGEDRQEAEGGHAGPRVASVEEKDEEADRCAKEAEREEAANREEKREDHSGVQETEASKGRDRDAEEKNGGNGMRKRAERQRREKGENGEKEGGTDEVNRGSPEAFQRGEVICVYENEAKETVADVLRYTAAGKPFKSLRAGILLGIPVSRLRRLEAHWDRIASDRRAGRSVPCPHRAFQLPPSPFFTRAVDRDRGALCFFWDLETTGLEIASCEITQIGCVPRLFREGRWERLAVPGLQETDTPVASEEAAFSAYIRIKGSIPKVVQELTGITESLLEQKGIPLSSALLKWAVWVRAVAGRCPSVPIWFVAHNGSAFDVPVLLRQEADAKAAAAAGLFPVGCFFRDVECAFTVDTLALSRALPWPDKREQSHSLSLLFSQLTGKGREKDQEHNALGDCLVLAELMEKEPFLSAWQRMNLGRTLAEEAQHQARWQWLDLSGLFGAC
ncbi:exonuclease [Besnoitia besnoiti]|uniref:Exonuclease n=1 Tax=Besnoitia besnoiti TaxID=94643 RepID=A0A2A9M7P3_BESBE|nr:exonuclease [Besnoitia besnoiti]PFH31667.1 exonuclease [Besnoitia besnoiti]